MKLTRLKSVIATALLVVSIPSMAATVELFNLGALSVPGGALLGNTFGSAGSYEDRYSFNIGQSATASGLVLELDPVWFNNLDISVTGVSLLGSSGLVGYDGSPGLYDFGGLGAGDYTLNIFSTVTGSSGLVGYGGLLALGTSRSTPVPEPGTLALLGMGLMGVALAARRRRAPQRS